MGTDDHGRADDQLDETLEETFPASDPPANTVETGVHAGAMPSPADVVDNRVANRFELAVDGELAVLEYERTPRALVLVHTEVPPRLRGRHLGEILANAAIAGARAEGLQPIAVCPFVKTYMRKHHRQNGST